MAPANDSSQAEIWDDSALVNSWNEALEEYKVRREKRIGDQARAVQEANRNKHYHSIRARGERAGDLLKQSSEAGTDRMLVSSFLRIQF